LHLRALLRCDRTNAEAFFDLGRAYENDPYGCDQRAVRFYLRAVKLNASEPKYRAVLGRALIRTNSIRSGIKVLCKAASAAPTDSEVMSVVVEGLREAGQAETAYELLSQSLFLAPNNRELKQLWNRTRFDMAQQRQLKQKEELPRPNQTGRILPFVRLNHGSECGIRHDEASSPAPHFLKLPVSRQ
jgi:cytochrome c-type biogenesis protein CcmH/NrfG